MADTFLFAQLQPYSLSGAGASIGDTSITLKSMLDIDGNTLSMSGTFGSIGFGTLEPGNGANEEQISFTGLTNNSNGTVTLSGVKSVAFVSPYTATSGLLKTHAGSTTFVISNTSGFYDRLSAKDDDETITGLWNFPNNSNYPTVGTTYVAPTTDLQIATKKYADDLAIAGAPKASTTTYGIAVLSTNAVSAVAPIVVGDNDPRVPSQNENDALVGTSGTASSLNRYVTNADTSTTSTAGAVVRATSGGKVDSSFVSVTDIQTFTTAGTSTWTKPTNAKWVEVTVIGAGGGGAAGSNGAATGGGGGGAYGFKRFNASALSSTESYTVGLGGPGGTQAGTNSGTAGGFSSFGTTVLLKAPGGSGGTATAGAGGVIGNGDIVYVGGAGGINGAAGVDTANVPSPRGGGGGGYNGGSPATATAGGNGGGFTTYYTKAGGAGGSAGVNNGTAASATSSSLIYGGVGGGGGGYNGNGTNTGGNGGDGNLGGGGGGANGTGTSGGAGGDGMVVVVTYF